MLDTVFSQNLIGLIHVAHDDGDVLEPAVVAARIDRYGATLGREVLGQLDLLVTQAQSSHSHPESEHALKPFVLSAPELDLLYQVDLHIGAVRGPEVRQPQQVALPSERR